MHANGFCFLARQVIANISLRPDSRAHPFQEFRQRSIVDFQSPAWSLQSIPSVPLESIGRSTDFVPFENTTSVPACTVDSPSAANHWTLPSRTRSSRLSMDIASANCVPT
jgi:hypothetical protein